MRYKILELNIGNPSLERAQRQCDWLREKNYDIYILTETRNSKGCSYISDYMEGTITREQFWVLARFKYPTHQIVFCTEKALKYLEYRCFEEVQE